MCDFLLQIKRETVIINSNTFMRFVCAFLESAGEYMEIQVLAEKIIAERGGIAKSADFSANGIRPDQIKSMCESGFLCRIRQGYYALSQNTLLSEEQLLSSLIPQGIVCMESALFHYGYSDFAPRKWTIAVPRTISRTRLDIDDLPLQAYYVQNELYALGKTESDFHGVSLPVYDRERTICDCFKYRSTLDNELFSKALNAYANDTNKNLKNLSEYAKKLRVHKKVTELMEVLLNG